MYEDGEEVMGRCVPESGPRIVVANVAFILSLVCACGVIISLTLPSPLLSSDTIKWCVTAFSAAAVLCITIACSTMLVDIIISGVCCDRRSEQTSHGGDVEPDTSPIPRSGYTTALRNQPPVMNSAPPVVGDQCRMRNASELKVIVVAAVLGADQCQERNSADDDQALDDGGRVITNKNRGDSRSTGQPLSDSRPTGR